MALLPPHPKQWPSDSYSNPKWTAPATPPKMSDVFNDMFFLGFSDQLSRWSSLANVNKPASFPPYNLIKVSDTEWKVELAVAGYAKDDIDITVERDQLVVASKDNDEKDDSTVVYQGIAKRSWRQKFILGEYMEVTSAVLKDGLLTITVSRNVPEELKPKVIKIK